MAWLISILAPLLRLIELLLQTSRDHKKDRHDEAVIRSLRQYRERLETAIAARRKARGTHDPSLNDHDDGGLPDDGFRRD